MRSQPISIVRFISAEIFERASDPPRYLREAELAQELHALNEFLEASCGSFCKYRDPIE